MIAKVLHGWRPGGLLAYLFGPGRHEEHRDPRVVASWDGAPWLHQPDKAAPVVLGGERIEPGEFDFQLGPLTTTMQDLAMAAGLPVSNPPAITDEWENWLRSGRRLPPSAPNWVRQYRYDRKSDAVVLRPGYVWHAPVRLHPRDRTLTDQEWQHIAERLMSATGIQQAGCRWIAVRHADDHIHLVATLVSEETGKRFYPRNDFLTLREECRALEREYGLVATSPADWTALRAPTRAEQGKAERVGRTETAREELRRVVRQAAASSQDGAEFLGKLAGERIRVQLFREGDDGMRGYAVALPGDQTAKGLPVWYSGTRLGRDLSWPKLQQRWADLAEDAPGTSTTGCGTGSEVTPQAEAPDAGGRMSPARRREALENATAVVERATEAVRAGRDVEGIAHATGEIINVLTRGEEGRGRGPLGEVSDRYDRAARTPYRVQPRRLGQAATELRRASRRIARVGRLSGRGREKFAALALVLALAALIAEIAAWQQTRGRIHQAAAARSAAGALPRAAGASASRRPAARPTQPVPPPAPGGARRDRPRVRTDTPAAAAPRSRRQGPG